MSTVIQDLHRRSYERGVTVNTDRAPEGTAQVGDPPVIDEAATIRPDQGPSSAATLSGVGVQLVTAWQSVSEIEAAYRRDAPAILN